jgi:hypothetical protein
MLVQPGPTIFRQPLPARIYDLFLGLLGNEALSLGYLGQMDSHHQNLCFALNRTPYNGMYVADYILNDLLPFI